MKTYTTPSVYHLLVVCLFLSIFLSNNLFSQVSHPCYENPNCTSEDFDLLSAYLANDSNGTPLQSGDCDNPPVDAFICMEIENNTNSNRDGIYIEGEFQSGPNIEVLGYCFDTLMIPNTPTILCAPAPNNFVWQCNSEVGLNEYIMVFTTAAQSLCQGDTINCDATTPAKCRIEADTALIVQIPIVVQFDWGCASASNTVDFIDLTIGGTGGYTYSWDFGDGTSSTVPMPTHTYPSVGTYQVILEVTDSSGDIDADTLLVDISLCCDLEVTCPDDTTFDCGDVPVDIFLGSGGTIDNQCGSVSITSDFVDPGICGGTVGVIFSIVDNNNTPGDPTDDSTETCEVTYTINPAPTPTFVIVSDITIGCEDSPPIGTILGYGNGETGDCEIQGSELGIITGSNSACGGIYTETWTYNDACNSISTSRTITVLPAQSPTYPSCPNYSAVDCETALSLTTSDYPDITTTNNGAGLCLLSLTATAIDVDQSAVNCNGSGVVVITYAVTDDCGGTYPDLVCNQLVNTAPQPVAPSCPIYVSVSCEDALNLITADYSDITTTNGLTGACNITITASASDVDASGVSCDGSGVVVVTYAVTDNCNGQYSDLVCDQAVEAAPTPVEPVCPVYASETCEDALNLTTADYTDITTTNGLTGACNIAITASASDVDASGVTCDGSGVVVVTYAVTDNCNGQYSDLVCDQSVDAAPQPVAPSCPTYAIVTCEDALNLTTTDYVDITTTNGLTGACSITITASASDVDVSGVSCDGNGVVEITYGVTDNCGGSYVNLVCFQTVEAAPTPAEPVCPVYASVTCEEALSLTTADYADITTTNGLTGVCNITITASASDVDASGVSCDGNGLVEITYTVTDNCGGSYANLICFQTVEAAPTPAEPVCPVYASVTCEGALNLTTADYSDITTTNGLTGACDITITASASDVDASGVSCDGSGVVVVTYTVTDNCNGQYTDLVCDQTVEAAPTPADPVCPIYAAVTCEDALNLTTADYTDITTTNGLTGACNITITASASNVDASGVACDGSGVVVVTYGVTDNCSGQYSDLVCDQSVDAAPQPVAPSCLTYASVSCEDALNLKTTDYSEITTTNGLLGACNITITATASDVDVSGVSCDGIGVVEITYGVTGNCGGSYANLVCFQTVEAAPTPAEPICPVYASVTCEEALSLTTADYANITTTNGLTGACNIAITASASDVDASGLTCDGSGVVVVTYAVTDNCNGQYSDLVCDQSVDAAPQSTAPLCPVYASVSCEDALNLTTADYADVTTTNGLTGACNITITATASDVDVSGVSCDGSGVVEITYAVTGNCGGSYTNLVCFQTVEAAPIPAEPVCSVYTSVTCEEALDLTTVDYADITTTNGLIGACNITITATASDVDVSGVACDGSGVVVVTYAVTDNCNGQYSDLVCDQSVDAAPQPIVPSCPSYSSVSCEEALNLTTLDYADIMTTNGLLGACNITITATASDVDVSGVSCDGNGVVEITYGVTDNCGGSYANLVCFQTVEAAPTPAEPICPVYASVTCEEALNLTTADYADITTTNGLTGACNITITATPTDVDVSGVACDGNGAVIITFTVIDNCSNSYGDLICNQTVDAVSYPAVPVCPVYSSVTCEEALDLTTADYADIATTNGLIGACNITITASASNVDASGVSCDGSGVVVVTYTVTDNCNGQYSDLVCDQTVEAAPVPAEPVCPVFAAVTCEDALNLTTADYSDITTTNGLTGACNITITASASDVDASGVSCDGSGVVVVTYAVTDNCNGQYTDLVCDQTVEAAPIPAEPGCPVYASVSCEDALNLTTADYTDITTTNGLTGACNITITASASEVDVSGVACDGSGVVVVTYAVTDNCNGEYSNLVCDQSVDAAPQSTVPLCPVYTSISCEDALNLTTADYTDITTTNGLSGACNITITATAIVVDVSGVSCDGNGVVEITYAVTDNCDGQYADLVCDQAVEAAPVPAEPVCPVYASVTCEEALNLTTSDFADITTTNGLTGACNITITASASDVDVSGVACDGIGVVVVTYAVTDNCNGQYSDLVCDQTVDAAPLPIAPSCPAFSSVSCEEALNLTTSDYADIITTNGLTGACNIMITASASIVDASGVSCDGNGVVEITYGVTDNCGGSYANLVCFQSVDAAPQPVAPSCPIYASVSCEDALNLTTADYADITTTNGLTGACNITITASASDVDASGVACDGSGVVVITYAVTDNCKGQYSDLVCDQTVEAASVPAEPVCPVYASVTCEEALSLTAADYTGISTTNGLTGACNITITASASDLDASGVSCDGSGVVVVTYAVTDNCNGQYSDLVCDQTVEAAPIPEVPVCPVYAAVSCEDALNLTTADYADITTTNGLTGACNITITASASDVDVSGVACDGSGVVVVTYAVTDNCNGEYSNLVCDQSVDAAPQPVEPICPTYASVTCEDALNLSTADYPDITSDNGLVGACSITITATATTVDANGVSCDGNGVVEINYGVTDNCGGIYANLVCFQTVEAAPTPAVPVCPVYAYVTCEEALSLTTADYDDIITGNGLEGQCFIEITAAATTVDVSGVTCDGTGVVLVNFTVTDNCNGSYADLVCSQTVDGAPAPVFDEVPGDITIQCSDPDPTGVTITYTNGLTDGCLIEGDIVGLISGEPVGCGDFYTETWIVADACGYMLEASRTITVIDTVAPIIADGEDETVECDGQGNVAQFEAWLANNGGATAVDNCSEAEWTNEIDGFVNNCGNTGTYTVSFYASDICENESNTQGTFTIVDTEGPEMEFVNPELVNFEDGDIWTIQCFGQEEEWNIPVLTALDVEALDDCEGVLSVSMVQNELPDGDCTVDGYIKGYEYVWTAQDACLNVSTLKLTIRIVDIIPPQIIGVPEDMSAECGMVPDPPFVYALDECMCSTLEFEESLAFEGCVDGNILTRTWTATDCCGNVTVEVQEIELYDNTPPQILVELPTGGIVYKDTVMTFDCSDGIPQSYLDMNDAMAIAIDACHGETPLSFVFKNTGQECSVGASDSYEYTWKSKDECGNVGSLTITLLEIDNEPPYIVDFDEVVCYDDDVFNFTVLDACNNNLFITYTEEVFVDACGEYTMRYFEVTDPCGNALELEQKILPEDITSPTYELMDVNLVGVFNLDTITLSCEGSGGTMTGFNESSVVFTDECLEGMTTEFEEVMLEEMDCVKDGALGLYNVLWSASDMCGNTTSFEVMAYVVDEEEPIFDKFEPLLEMSCDEELPELFVDDMCGVSSIESTYDTIPGNCPIKYSIIRTVTATDGCENTAVAEQIVQITDYEGPEIDIESFVCDDFEIPEVMSYDDCETDPIVAQMIKEDTIVNQNCPDRLVVERTWLAIDECGNETVEKQIVAEPSEDPAVVLYDENIEGFIGIETIVPSSDEELNTLIESLNKYDVVAYDPCLNLPFETSLEVDVEEANCLTKGYYEKRTYTWYLTIPCSDDIVQSAVFYMTDDIAPLPPMDDEFFDLGCNTAPDFESMTFPFSELIIDPLDVEITKKISVEDGIGETIVTVAWILEDGCGNTSTFARTYYMINESVITCEIESPENIYCNSHGNILVGIPSGGEAPYEYEWQIEGKQCFIQSGQNTDSLEIYVGFWDVYVTLTITDANGCSTVCQMTIDCIPDFENRASSGDQFYMSNVSPNPAHTDISYQVGADNDMIITEKVYDFNGRELMKNERLLQKGVNDIRLKIFNMQPGVYILKVENEESSYEKRFIKIN